MYARDISHVQAELVHADTRYNRTAHTAHDGFSAAVHCTAEHPVAVTNRQNGKLRCAVSGELAAVSNRVAFSDFPYQADTGLQ